MKTRSKIKETAFRLFSEKGTAFTLNEIAEEVGIKKASIYAHFINKDMILKTVIEEEMSKYFFNISQENKDLKKIFFGLLEYFSESKIKLLFWKRLLLLEPDTFDPDISKQIKQMSDDRFQAVETIIEKEMQNGVYKTGNSREITLMFFSLIHGLLSSVLIYHPYDIWTYYEGIWNHFNTSILNTKEK
jgi:AcrR family transcriptional regulator